MSKLQKDNITSLMREEASKAIPYDTSMEIDSYLHQMENPSYFDKPDKYGVGDYLRDAWTDWNISRNEVNRSTELGKFQLDQVKINELDDAEEYLKLITFNQSYVQQVEIPEELKTNYDKIASQYNLSGSISDQIDQISSNKESLFESQKQALDNAAEYQKSAQDWKDKHDISDYYQFKKEEGIFDQYDMDSYLYKLPGIFGSSAASMGLQAMAAVAGLGASVLLTGGLSTPAVLAAIAGSATAYGLNVASAKRENQAEVFDNLKNRVIEQTLNDGTYTQVLDQAKRKLGDKLMSDEEAMNAILTGQVKIDDEAFNKSVKTALTGTEQLYISDNALVLGTEAIETAAMIIPWGKLAKAGKLGKLGKSIESIKTAKAKAFKPLNDRIDAVKYFGIDKSIKGMSSKTIRSYTLDLLGRKLVQSGTEMIEESGQYLNAQDFIAGKYDGKQPSYIDGIIDNYANAARSLYSFYAPWDTALSSDKEWLENARSGFVLGLLNIPSVVRDGLNARNAYKQVKADHFVEDVASNDIFADKDRLNKNIYYAENSTKDLSTQLVNAFDKAKELGIDNISSEMWDEEKEHAVRINNLVNSKKVHALAAERGYKPGTNDFNIYVGMIDYYQERYQESLDKYNKQAEKINEILEKESRFNDAFTQDFGISNEEYQALSEEEKNNATAIRQYTVNRAKLNAQLTAYEEMMNDLQALDRDATELYSKFGITYNKSDLTTVRSILKQQYDNILKEDKLASEERDVELPSIQRDLVNAYKNVLWTEVDVTRSENDLQALVKSVKEDTKAAERTKRKLNKYKKVQKQNQEFEQQIQDDHRQEAQEPEIQSVEVTETRDEVAPESQPEVVSTPEVKTETAVEPSLENIQEPLVEETVESKTEDIVEVKKETTEEDKIRTAELQKEIEDKRKIISEARKSITEIGTETTSKYKAEKNRDAAIRRAVLEGKEVEQSLDYYSQGVTHIYNRTNPYGKVHEDANDALISASEQIDGEIGSIMSKISPDQAWKYKEGVRKPYFVQSDIDYIQSNFDADVERIEQIINGQFEAENEEIKTAIQSSAQQSLNIINQIKNAVSEPLRKVFDAYSELSDLQAELEEAISDVDIRRADELVSKINAAIKSLNDALDIYVGRQESVEQTNREKNQVPSYSEKGHQLINAGENQEQNNDFIKYSAAPDFIINSTVTFETTGTQIFTVFNYKGKRIRTRLSPDSSAWGIIEKIKEYQQQVNKNSSLQIVPVGIARTNGRIQHGTEERKLTEVKNHWTIPDIYDINSENTIIGIGTGDSIRRGTTILRNQKSELGRLYWFADVYRPEIPVGKSQIPIHLNPVKIKDLPGVSELILQCFEQINQAEFTLKDGTNTPIQPKRLLDFLVYNGIDTYVDEQKQRRYTSEQVAQMQMKQLYIGNDGRLVVGNMAYELTALQSDSKLRQIVLDYIDNNFNFRIQDENLYSNWGNEELKESNPFYGLKSWFQLYGKDKLTLVPNIIEFDRKMVGLDSTKPKGISVLGYYIDKGLIKTDFVGLADAKLYIKDVALVNKEDRNETNEAIEEIITTESDELKIESADDLAAFFEKEFGPLYVGTEKVTRMDLPAKDKARRIISKLTDLSEDQIEIIDDILGVTQSGEYILGQARLDSIALSTMSVEGVEYHETWHRISNLLMEPRQREKLFSQVRKKFGKDLSDIEVDEILAERFREFQLNVAENIDYTTTNVFKRIWNFIKALANLKSWRLARLYNAINRGEFASLKPSQENIDRFNKLYVNRGPLYTYRSTQFNTISNSKTLNGAIDSLMYLLFNMPDKDGKITSIVDYTDVTKISLDNLKIMLAKSNNPVFKELFQNFDVVEKILKQKLKAVQVNYLEKVEQELVNENTDEDLGKIDMDDYTKASYEIDKFGTAPAEVKFFFTTIPEKVWNNGKMTLVKDPLTGLPRFFNPRFAWNVVLNDLYTVSTIQELQDEVNLLAQTQTLYAGIKVKLDRLVDKSKNGTEEEKTNAEATLTKILVNVHSNKNTFLTVRANVDTIDGVTTHKLDVIDNTVETKSRALPQQFSQNMFTPGSVFEYNSQKGIQYSKNGAHNLNSLIKFYNLLEQAITSKKGIFVTDKGSYDLHDVANQVLIKERFIGLLGKVGIQIDLGTIDEMLKRAEYGDGTEYSKFVNFFVNSSAYYGGMRGLINRLKTLQQAFKSNPTNLTSIEYNGEQIELRTFYTRNGFVKELAKAFINYHSNTDNLTSIASGGNLMYGVSQNNFFTDRTDELNRDSEIVDKLLNCHYQSSSLILEQVKNGAKISAQTFVNFKTNNPGDMGSDYHGITDLEDYISKMTLALNGRLLCPTIADKKTYHVISGLQLPNERFRSAGKANGVRQFMFGNTIVNQIIKYAKSELAAVQQCINQLDPNSSEYLSEDQRIKNYHTTNKYKIGDDTYKIEPNGTRFRFLTGVYILDAKGKESFISFNDPKKSSIENIKTATSYFFNQPIEVQQYLINNLLSKRVNEEIQYAISMGLIEETDGIVTNKLLDDRFIKERAEHYKKQGYAQPEQVAIMDIIAQYTTNSIISVNEIERVFSGDPAFYKWIYNEDGPIDVAVDKIKRLGSLTSTGLNNRLDFDDFDSEYTCAELKDYEIGSRQFTNTLVPLFIDSSIREVVKQVHGIQATLHEDGTNKTIEELKTEYPRQIELAEIRAKKEVAGYGKGINVADAAVYVTPEFYAKMMRSIGFWNSEIEEAYRILTNPKDEIERNWESQAIAYEKIMKASLKPLKYMAFGHRFENGLAVPYFNKMALFPLFESIATGDIHKLYERMTDKNDPIDMVLFESAVKAGSKNPLSWKDSSGNVNDLSKLTKYKQNMKYLRQQLATDPHTHEEQMAGTQMLKVALANLDLLGNYGFGNKRIKGSVIRDTIFAAMNELSDRGKARLEKKLLDEYGNIDQEKLSKWLLEDLETQDADNNILDGVEYDSETGKMKLNLSAISNNSWLESRFLSTVNKEVIDINLPGGAFIQRSAFGLAADQADVISDKMLNNGVALKTIDEKDGSLQAIVSINLFKHIIPNYKDMTFSEAREWLFEHGVIGENSEPSAIGYRIPTQAQASIQALKFMDVMPEIMGDTIVLPEDFTKQTGSDFDIDKLYISRYAFDKNGKKIVFNDSKGMEGNSENAIKNKLIEQYITVLTTLEYTNQLKVSIDNATDTVKSVLEKIESKKKQKIVQPFEVYSPQYQEARKSEYTVGKAGIGPFALNNAHHILTQLMEIEYKENDFTRTLNLINLGKQYDDDKSGRRILDWLSAMINAFVDIAKDPYIVRLNVNPYTYNMTAYLLRMGKGEQTFYFLNQPIIKEVADAVMKVRGNYGKDTTRTQTEIEQEATNKVLEKYGITKSVLEAQRTILQDPKDLAIQLSGLFDGQMENMLLSDKISEEDKRIYQAKIWLAWQAMRPYAQSMADLVKYSKIDTKKMGKSFAEQKIFENGMKAMEDFEGSMFAKGEVTRFYNGTFLRKKAENSMIFARKMFENQLVRTTPAFMKSLNAILYRLGKTKSVDSRMLRTVINSMEAAIKSDFFNQQMQEKDINPMDFFYGENSIANRLIKLRNKIYNNELPDLKGLDGGFANELLNFLIPNTVKYETTFNEPDYVDIKTMFDQDLHTKNNIIVAWEELLQHTNKEVSKLAEDLIYYAFLTSGDNKNMNSFFEFVPTSWREKYSEYLQDRIDNNDTYVDYQDIFLNNWADNQIVPRIDYKYSAQKTDLNGEFIVEEHQLQGIQSKFVFPNTNVKPYLIFTGEANGMDRITPLKYIKVQEDVYNVTGIRQYPLYPSFVKIRYGNNTAPSSYMTYKLIGYNKKVTKQGNVTYTPIYLAVNKKGYKYKGHVITEYGRTDGQIFNYFPIGIEDKDFVNGNLNKMIQNNPRFNAQQKALYKSIFDTNFKPINQLQSYANLAISDMYHTITEQEDNSFENQDKELQSKTIKHDGNILQQYLNDQETNVNWSRYADNGYEVSSQGDKRFSALNATFKEGTVIDGIDVGGRTIEDVYQSVIKKSGKGQAPSKDSKLYNPSLTTKEQQEDYSYSEDYLPLWQEWARQNPSLIEELREKSNGKTLTDKFASTRVSQARALAEILNNTKRQRPSEKC